MYTKIKMGFIIALLLTISSSLFAKGGRDFYQMKIYHLKNNEQVNNVDEYLQNVYLPALHRLNIKNIGVFKPIANDTAAVKYIYVLIPFKSEEEWVKLDKNISKDKVYDEAAKGFLAAPSDKAPYERMESILLEAFSKASSNYYYQQQKMQKGFLN